MSKWMNVTSMAILLAAAASGCRTNEPRRAEPRADEPFFFIQMTDPQLGMFTDNQGLERDTELFERAIAHANRLGPVFVVITGDLVNQEGNPRQIAELRRVADKLDDRIGLHWVAGNHDVGNEPTPQRLADYRETFGEDWYAFAVGRCRFVVLDSCLIHNPKQVADEARRQREWLEATLDEARQAEPRHLIVFMHHPLFLKSPDEPDEYFNVPLERRRIYLDLLSRSGVRAVFAGHYHRNSFGRHGPMEMVTTGPVGKPLGKDPSGLRIVKVYPDRIEHAYHALDAVPDKVQLEPLPD